MLISTRSFFLSLSLTPSHSAWRSVETMKCAFGTLANRMLQWFIHFQSLFWMHARLADSQGECRHKHSAIRRLFTTSETEPDEILSTHIHVPHDPEPCNQNLISKVNSSEKVNGIFNKIFFWQNSDRHISQRKTEVAELLVWNCSERRS